MGLDKALRLALGARPDLHPSPATATKTALKAHIEASFTPWWSVWNLNADLPDVAILYAATDVATMLVLDALLREDDNLHPRHWAAIARKSAADTDVFRSSPTPVTGRHNALPGFKK